MWGTPTEGARSGLLEGVPSSRMLLKASGASKFCILCDKCKPLSEARALQGNCWDRPLVQ